MPTQAQAAISFGRAICGDLDAALRREWLVTNGIGGFAAGTIAGAHTRRYHGLLVAALRPPLDRTLLLSKLDEWAELDGAVYPLACNEFQGGIVDPHGYRHLESFHLDGTLPVWRYALADAILEKRVWMVHGQNTTYITYRLARGQQAVRLGIVALANYRDYHSDMQAPTWTPHLEICATLQENGHWEAIDGRFDMKITMFETAAPFFLTASLEDGQPPEPGALRFEVIDHLYRDFHWRAEAERQEPDREDLTALGRFYVDLQPGQTLCLVASTVGVEHATAAAALSAAQTREIELLSAAQVAAEPAWIRQLTLAADQFIVARDDGHTVIAGYPWFTDWGRDTMIALPGLALSTGRPELAASLLRTFARYVHQGMLPNRFPDAGEALGDADYNTVDATLWYFEAVRATVDATGDLNLLRNLFPVLQDIVDWHVKGTRFQIHVDPTDGLLYAGEPGVQLTWMDAKVGDWVVTPRQGKAVEINALWYHALCVMADFAQRLGQPAAAYEDRAAQVRLSFARFWHDELGFCADVLDGPAGDDVALRPNQLLAVSLPNSPLTPPQQRRLLDACARHLLTSIGLRSLAPGDPQFIGLYLGDRRTRDGAYHQGTTWAWLIGPFVQAHLRVYQNRAQARAFLEPFRHHLSDAGLGSISEIADGDAPFTPRGCPWQAWSVAEVLRTWKMLNSER